MFARWGGGNGSVSVKSGRAAVLPDTASRDIKAVIFDLGRTLVPFSFDPLEKDLRDCRQEVFALTAEFERGKISSPEFVRRLCSLASVAPGNFDQWWCSIFNFETLVPDELIHALAQRHRMGLLSNTNQLHFDFLRKRLPIINDFDFLTLSYEVGAVKPEAAIFADAEQKAVCDPPQIIYFDDVEAYVEAARVRGWNAYQFTGLTSVKRALKRHHVSY
jgi:putative hydrolase of the HAD superfamily